MKLKEKFEQYRPYARGVAKLKFFCDECEGMYTEIALLGKKKEHTYFVLHCVACNKIKYISIDTLKHRPKLK